MGGTGLGFVGICLHSLREIRSGYYMGIIMHAWEIHTLNFIPRNDFPSRTEAGLFPKEIPFLGCFMKFRSSGF